LGPFPGEEVEVFLTASSTDLWSGNLRQLDLVCTTACSSFMLAMDILPMLLYASDGVRQVASWCLELAAIVT
jgi:hypothetical protein